LTITPIPPLSIQRQSPRHDGSDKPRRPQRLTTAEPLTLTPPVLPRLRPLLRL
jgi:hypothetical protein